MCAVKNLILMDVKNENETKRVSVILRVTSLVLMFYFLILVGMFLSIRNITLTCLGVLCFALYGFAFYATYLNQTKRALWFNQLLMIFWVIVFIHQLGWDCGVQHFIFVLVVLCFTTSYAKARWKFVECLGLCILRYGLFFYTRNHVPLFDISSRMECAFQILDTAIIFLNITTILYAFTLDAVALEKKLVDYNNKLHKQASVDPLTGLYNRRFFLDYLRNLVTKGDIPNGLCIAIADIDFFKKVNDTYGHDVGDQVLKEMAEIFSQYMEGKGAVARWGGEEFLFAFENCNLDDANIYMMDILRLVKNHTIHSKNQDLNVTITAGVDEYGFRQGDNIEITINAADKKLYMGKEAGRNRVVF